MAAGRKQQLASSAAVAVALVAMLVLVAAAAAQDCGVSRDTMNKCLSYCSSGGNADACCGPLTSGANLDCLCKNYWGKLQAYPSLANCANKIKSRCGINRSC
ncbi:male-cone protein 1-like [Panicum miliaceum]|uniref:Male-cone protein 1-like n=1 Tax=Panicum miliaceum TaxID=4540 RepID=A0A3L6RF47_PANMI|nr:male-cone protein 1-like [Panicum miliaceum]